MMQLKHLRLLLALLGLMLSGFTAEAKEKGDKAFKDGQAAELQNDWDKALDFYQQALDQNPKNTAYTIAMRRARFQGGQMHVNRGQKLRTGGKLPEALGEFQKALLTDPGSAIAIQELKRTQAMIDAAPGTKPGEIGLTPGERAKKEMDDRVASIQAPPELKPLLGVITSLKMNNQPPKVLYETVGKMAGVNVVFDSQYSAPSRNFNVDLNNSSIDQAFDYLAVLTRTFWKPISANTIFVTEDNVTKRRDYEDEVVKVFYVTNATSVQEFQEIATAIRTVAEIRRVFTYNAQKAMVVRGSLDQVALAEKLIHDLDKPKSEVIVDVIVMQANSDRTRNLAATIASAGTAGLNMAAAFTPLNGIQTAAGAGTGTGVGTGIGTGTPTTTPSSAITLAQLPHVSIHDFTTSLPGALLTALMSDTKTKVVNSPQVRASDGMKATLKIGQRIPYATGSFQPGVGTVGVSPLVSTQFSYADVGVNLLITPQVHSAQELTLHVEIEVSSVQQYVNLGGISQPVIGQNKNDADIRLRDGEVTILGGLSQSADSSTLNGLPGLTNIPVLGKFLFGQETTDKSQSQLLIALIPHIVRSQEYSPENLRGIYAGSDQTVKLYYAPKKEEAPAPNQQPPAAMSPVPAGPLPGGVVSSVSSAPASTNLAQPPMNVAPPAATVPQAPPRTVQPAALAPSVPATSSVQPSAVAQSRIKFVPAVISTTVGSTVTVTLEAESAADLFSVSPIRVKYDPSQLKLNDAAAGELFTRDGIKVTAAKDIRNDSGEATLTVSRLPGSKGISGTGTIATLNFVAVGKGTSTITLPELSLKNTQLQPLAIAPAELSVTIK